MMRAFKYFASVSAVAILLAGCEGTYRDEIQPLTEQEVADYKDFHPSSTLRSGVFHMQRVDSGPSVRLEQPINLKRPDLPPFDVAYISRNVEQVLLELAHAAGESIVIPQGLRTRTVTVVHSGANFREMLNIVLSKVGYHYNYVDGVWYVTRFPVRTYQVEVGQSDRSGSIVSSTEFSPETAGGTSNTSVSSELDTQYTDSVWEQIDETLTELIMVGNLDASEGGTASKGVRASGGFVSGTVDAAQASIATDTTAEEDLFGNITEEGGLQPEEQEAAPSEDHLQPEEKAEPWYKMTRSAGLVTVRAAPEAHRLIEEYLNQVQDSALRQINVEVRIIALTKDRSTSRGFNYNSDNVEWFDSVLGSVGFESSTPLADPIKGFGFSVSKMNGTSQDLGVVVQMLSQTGTVYNISSPSILARNNQLSRISLTRQLGYAETEVEQNTTSGGSVVIGSRTDTPKFKNAGTVLSVFPYIGKRKVQMRMRLSLATKSGETEIETRVGATDAITNLVPELANNIIDQDMVLEYGRVYAVSKVIGTEMDTSHDYVPGLADIPGVSEAFKHARNNRQDTEFIVLLRVARQ